MTGTISAPASSAPTETASSNGQAIPDRIRHVKYSTLTLPLDTPISDAKVLTGVQKPMTEIVFLFVEIGTEQGHSGIGFSYSKRAGAVRPRQGDRPEHHR